MISIGSDGSAFVIMHSWPGPRSPMNLLNIIMEESFENTQHAFCFSIDTASVPIFLEGAVYSGPALRYTNVDVVEDAFLYKPLIEQLAKDGYTAENLNQAQTCLQNHFLRPHDHATGCSHLVPGSNWKLITNMQLPRFFNPEEGLNTLEYSPAKLIPFPWIAAKQWLNTENAGLNIILLLEHSPIERYGATALPAVPEDMVYFIRELKITAATRQNRNHLFRFYQHQNHAKIGVFLQSPEDTTNGVVCFGDANHVASISLKAGMEVCFDEPLLAALFFQSSSKESASLKANFVPSQLLPNDQFSWRNPVQKTVYTSKAYLQMLLPGIFLQEAAPAVNNNDEVEEDIDWSWLRAPQQPTPTTVVEATYAGQYQMMDVDTPEEMMQEVTLAFQAMTPDEKSAFADAALEIFHQAEMYFD
jgi:hypothetical protein